MKKYLIIILLHSFLLSSAQVEKVLKLPPFIVDGKEYKRDDSIIFTVYTTDKIDTLIEIQRNYTTNRIDSMKCFLKDLIDKLPKQTFVKTVQKEIYELTFNKLRDDYITPQKEKIDILEKEINSLKEEIKKLKKI